MEEKMDMRAAVSSQNKGTTAVWPLGKGVRLQAEGCNDANKYTSVKPL